MRSRIQIRIRNKKCGKLDPDPHWSQKLDLDPHLCDGTTIDMILPVAGGLEGLQGSEEPGDGLLLVHDLHIPLLGAQVVNQLEQQVFWGQEKKVEQLTQIWLCNWQDLVRLKSREPERWEGYSDFAGVNCQSN